MTRRGVFMWWIGVGQAPVRTLHDVGSHLQRVFGIPTWPWTAPQRPRDTFDARRGQHLSGRFLEWLLAHEPPGAIRTLGLTDVDLAMPVLTFVYGEAQLNGRVAVVSSARLGGSPTPAGERLLTARLAKESVHELGHTFGLLHCSMDRCVMRRSVSLATIDNKSTTLCGECRTLLLERTLDLGHTHE